MKQLVLCLLLACIPLPASSQIFIPIPVVSSESVTLYGEVTLDSASRLVAAIQEANEEKTSEPIYLYINSPGGDILSGGMIVDAMAASRRPVYTVDVGLAASMAALIHTYGAKRYMLPHSVLMFHRASMGLEDDISHVEQRIALLEAIVADYEQHLAKMTGLSVAEIQAHEDHQWWMLPAEAQKNHLIDGVLNPPKYPTR